MAYRFTDTGKWNDPWFLDLSAHEKLMFNYFCDNCDIAGFMQLSLRKMIFDLNLNEDQVKVSFKGLGRAYILSLDKTTIFLKNFIRHQKNWPLKEDNKAHKGIISRIEENQLKFSVDILEYLKQHNVKFKGLQSPTGKGNGTGILNLVDYNKGIDFENFWDLYGKKMGDKKEVNKKWSSLSVLIQQKILDTLPEFKKNHPDKQFRPHPETYLNQQRWNDEFEPNEIKLTGTSNEQSTYQATNNRTTAAGNQAAVSDLAKRSTEFLKTVAGQINQG